MKTRRRRTSLGVLAVSLATGITGSGTSVAHALGLDGPEGAVRRVSASIGTGLDRVGGYGQNTYPFLEVSASDEELVWKRLVLGGSFSLREDMGDHNDALGTLRGQRSTAVAAQLFVGYDGSAFHVSAGPWLYGASRDRPAFRARALPYGFLRLRFGHQDRWHFKVRLADGVPFTAEGAALGLRLMLGAPVWRGHRVSGGLYTSIGEKTLGLTWTDEMEGRGPAGTALRWGGLLGCDLDQGLSRPELTGFVGLVW